MDKTSLMYKTSKDSTVKIESCIQYKMYCESTSWSGISCDGMRLSNHKVHITIATIANQLQSLLMYPVL